MPANGAHPGKLFVRINLISGRRSGDLEYARHRHDFEGFDPAVTQYDQEHFIHSQLPSAAHVLSVAS